jgi:hypothetical protein
VGALRVHRINIAPTILRKQFEEKPYLLETEAFSHENSPKSPPLARSERLGESLKRSGNPTSLHGRWRGGGRTMKDNLLLLKDLLQTNP